MNRKSWFFTSVALGLSMAVHAPGQDSELNSGDEKVAAPTEQNQVTKSAQPASPFAKIGDQQVGKSETPKKQTLRFPVGGFTGNNAFPVPPLRAEPQQGQADMDASQRRADQRNFNRARRSPRANQPPVYLPHYNMNRPYGYPYGYPYGGYPGYGYRYGYGYGYGVLRPGVIGGGGVPGGSNYFGNPHASQYLGNPHASQGP